MNHRASAHVDVCAPVDAVLDVALTVDDMVRWFPLEIRAVDPPADGRLCVGDSCDAENVFAGRHLRTTIHVLRADETAYELSATGLVCFDVKAQLEATPQGCGIDASVEARSGGGLTGRVLEAACRPLLAPALRQALERLARLAEARRPVSALGEPA